MFTYATKKNRYGDEHIAVSAHGAEIATIKPSSYYGKMSTSSAPPPATTTAATIWAASPPSRERKRRSATGTANTALP